MFHEDGYQIVRGVISKDAATIAATELLMIKDAVQSQEPDRDLSDPQVPNAFSWYSPFIGESLLQYLHPVVEQICGEELYPTYSYARIYYNGNVLEHHKDRPSCEISATLTLKQTTPWDIWMENISTKEYTPQNLETGDICIYRGNDIKHGREPYTGEEHVQVFLHFVRVNGDYAEERFDGREKLGTQRPKPFHVDN